MKCASCHQIVTPGMEIVVDAMTRDRAHCPYCLAILPDGPNGTTATPDPTLATKRTALRTKIRGQFVDRLLESSSDDLAHCPVCDEKLSVADERLLRSNEHFNCHLCAHDLAALALKQDAYHEQRWLPVVYALGDVRGKKECGECCYLGAMAKACERAFAVTPGLEAKPSKSLVFMLGRSEWKAPDCDWGSCIAVKQYRKIAAEGMLLL